jgi:hypothetical protein
MAKIRSTAKTPAGFLPSLKAGDPLEIPAASLQRRLAWNFYIVVPSSSCHRPLFLV